MKLLEFAKTTFLGGLVLIVPLAVLLISLGYLLSLLISLNSAVAEYLPAGFFGRPEVVFAIAVVTIIGVCFAAGLLLRTGVGASLSAKLDQFLSDKLPMYGMIKKLTQRFTGSDGLEFTPAEVDIYGNQTRVLAFVMEELPGDRLAVFVPSSPALTMGQVYLLPSTQVTVLDATPRLAVDAITQWGTGARELYKGSTVGDAQPG